MRERELILPRASPATKNVDFEATKCRPFPVRQHSPKRDNSGGPESDCRGFNSIGTPELRNSPLPIATNDAFFLHYLWLAGFSAEICVPPGRQSLCENDSKTCFPRPASSSSWPSWSVWRCSPIAFTALKSRPSVTISSSARKRAPSPHPSPPATASAPRSDFFPRAPRRGWRQYILICLLGSSSSSASTATPPTS